MYSIDWMIPNAETYSGIGVLDHGKLAVAYSSTPGYGIMIYTINGGKLSGNWINTKGDVEFGQEELEGPAGLDGTYQITSEITTYFNEDFDEEYSGTVEIHPFGEVYNIAWYTDDSGEATSTGVGILDGKYLIAAWGTDAGVMLFDVKDNELLGRFAATGANRTGIENLARQAATK